MFKRKKNQCLIIKGDSDSGKTLLFDNVLLSLCKLSKLGKKKENLSNIKIIDEDFENKIISAYKLLKLFGGTNKKKNYCSTKYILRYELFFEKEKKNIIGGCIKFYLFDFQNLFIRDKEESNYKIFYTLLNQSDSKLLNSLYLDSSMKNSPFLNYTNYYNYIISEKREEIDLSSIFQNWNFSNEEVDLIFRILGAIIHLGNIDFKVNSISSNIEQTLGFINEEKNLNYISDLLQIKIEDLKEALLYNKKTINGNTIIHPFSYEEAIASRNSFGIELYSKLIDYIITKINIELNIKKQQGMKTIVLIEFPGSRGNNEMQHNCLSNLCVNYTNEKIIQYFINQNYKQKINILTNEGVFDHTLQISKYPDNTSIIDLFENESSGLFASISNACENNILDNEFFQDIVTKFSINEHITFPSLNSGNSARRKTSTNLIRQINHSSQSLPQIKNIFAIYHSNGLKVEYDTHLLLSENYNEVGLGIYDCLLSSASVNLNMVILGSISSNDLLIKKEQIYDEFIMSNGNVRRSMFITNLFLEKIGKILDFNSLDSEFEHQAQFCFCIKTNTDRDNMIIYPRLVYNQLINFDVNNIVKYSKHSYDIILPYKRFSQIFEKSLLDPEKGTDKEKTKQILEKLSGMKINDLKNNCLLGNNNIFIQIGYYDYLIEREKEICTSEKESLEVLVHFIDVYYYKLKFKRMKNGVIKIQRIYRQKRKINKEKEYLKKVILIQSSFRKKIIYSKIKQLKYCTIIIQSYYKRHYQMRHLKQIKKAILYLVPRLIKFVYRTRIKEKKGIRGCVLKIIQKAYDKIIEKKKNKAATYLNSYFRMILFRINNPTLIKKIIQMKFKRQIISAAIVIQSYYRGQKMFIQFHVMKFCTDYIRSFWKMKKINCYIIKLRTSTKKIQNSVKIFIYRKKAMEKATKFYLERKFEPSYKEELLKIQSYLKEIIDDFVDKNKNSSYYNNKKTIFFTKILDIDIYNATNIIYNNEYWIDKFSALEKFSEKLNNPIMSIQTSETHTVLLNSKGKIFSFGWNDNNQCVNSDINLYHIVNHVVVNDKSSFCLTNKGEIIMNGNYFLLNKNIKSISVNKKQLNEVYGLFQNKDNEHNYYIVKQNDNSNNLIMSKVPIFHMKIDKIVNGSNFTIFLTNSGVLYSMGNKNLNGELGHGDYIPRKEPKMIKIFVENGEKITNIKCGFKHCICIGSTGKVYGWGSNSHGQLCVNKNGNYPTPMRIKMEDYIKKGKKHFVFKAISIACGFRSSFIMDENRNIYFCGVGGVANLQSNVICNLKNYSEEVNLFILTHKNSYPIKLNCTWNGCFSVLYVTFCTINKEKEKKLSPQKIKWFLKNITQKWDDEQSRKPQLTKTLIECI